MAGKWRVGQHRDVRAGQASAGCGIRKNRQRALAAQPESLRLVFAPTLPLAIPGLLWLIAVVAVLAMPDSSAIAEWRHRGCSVRLISRCPAAEAYRIQHCSGMPMGSVASLEEARILIDDDIQLLRQRLVASA
jgi:hypothetical protein